MEEIKLVQKIILHLLFLNEIFISIGEHLCPKVKNNHNCMENLLSKDFLKKADHTKGRFIYNLSSTKFELKSVL